MLQRLLRAKAFISDRIQFKPKLGIVLGSGLGEVASKIENPIIIPYSDIPEFPSTTIVGHQGALYAGTINGVPCVLLSGRVHGYEGYSQEDIVFGVRVLCLLGIETIVITNAAGGVNMSFKPGELMLISDHLNLSGKNPLTGPNLKDLGPRFLDLTECYQRNLRDATLRVAQKLNIKLHTGVYAVLPGPCYETPAEVRMLRTLGADAVGMSTVPEAIAATHLGIQVVAFSMISNMAAGISGQKLSHEEVTDTAKGTAKTLSQLIEHIAPEIVSRS